MIEGDFRVRKRFTNLTLRRILPLLLLFVSTPVANMIAQTSSKSREKSAGTVEATRVAGEFWRQHLTHCGESYYAVWHVNVWQNGRYVSPEGTAEEFKGGSVEIRAYPVTEAQKLNGISWLGMSVFRAKVSRQLYLKSQQPRWSPWADAGSISVKMEKVNGQWSIKEVQNPLDAAHNCAWAARIADGRVPNRTIASHHLEGCTSKEDLTLTDVNFTVTGFDDQPVTVWFWNPFRLEEVGSAGAIPDCYQLVVEEAFPEAGFGNHTLWLRDDNSSKLSELRQEIVDAQAEWRKNYPN